jgi:hypothetical protein
MVEPTAVAPLRLRRPHRDQVTPVPAYLDALLPAGSCWGTVK